jgi:hypothetical protein
MAENWPPAYVIARPEIYDTYELPICKSCVNHKNETPEKFSLVPSLHKKFIKELRNVLKNNVFPDSYKIHIFIPDKEPNGHEIDITVKTDEYQNRQSANILFVKPDPTRYVARIVVGSGDQSEEISKLLDTLMKPYVLQNTWETKTKTTGQPGVGPLNIIRNYTGIGPKRSKTRKSRNNRKTRRSRK